MAEIRAALSARNLTFREAVIEGRRHTLLETEGAAGFVLRDASFKGTPGVAPGFDADSLRAAVRSDAEVRLSDEVASAREP